MEGDEPSEAHFLRFTAPVKGMQKRHVAIAFELAQREGEGKGKNRKRARLADRFRIVPANPGRVAVFFPAEKETSGLRFHLHAPFVPELSRASVKDMPANTPLFTQLAELAAGALPKLRDMGLLNTQFLGVLPNLHDTIPFRYKVIRETIIAAMKEQPLTPTHSRKYAPAKLLYQSSESLKSLLSPEDLAVLIGVDARDVDWAVAATQKNSEVDRFLEALNLAVWKADQFVRKLTSRLGVNRDSLGARHQGPDAALLTWLHEKDTAWHQTLYAWLSHNWSKFISTLPAGTLESAQIVRASTGDYKTGEECFFPSNGVEEDLRLPRVAKEVYTSGKNMQEQEKAKEFLIRIGVREVDEAVEVEAILKQRYGRDAHPPDDIHFADLKQFIGLVEKNPTHASLFRRFYILHGSDGKWHTPREVYLDRPYRDTGLAVYYDAIGPSADRVAVHDRYSCSEVDERRFTAFCRDVGVQTALSIEWNNLRWSHHTSELMWEFPGARRRSSSTAEDWTIPHLEAVFKKPSVPLARLISNTMCQAKENVLEARYSPNKNYRPKVGPSTLVHILAEHAWVPQDNGEFVRPSQADRARLPKGFRFDPGQPWIAAIGFGTALAERQEEYRREQAVAKKLGINSKEELDEAKWFLSLSPDERQRFKREHDRQSSLELPDTEPADPARRAQCVGEQAADAPDRQKEKRQRSVAMEYEAVKQEARQYLRPQYTNHDRETICQVCQAPLPFKLANGHYYFEAVEFLPELKTKKHYYQNHLALCPNHAAMFVHANDSKDALISSFLQMDEQELPVVLAEEERSIYFTKKHIIDLKELIKANQDAPEDA